QSFSARLFVRTTAAIEQALKTWLLKIQSTPAFVFGDDPTPVFELEESWDAFKHDGGRDLSGYEDGTENPKDDAAVAAAIAADGSSFVAVQRWLHDFTRFEAMQPAERDDCIGRRR
ncbi:MAG: hypothetical protein HGA75_13665, partial [Thiobacillus sp.]|nr:hypothetical protein [Thiobacillus sp.]